MRTSAVLICAIGALAGCRAEGRAGPAPALAPIEAVKRVPRAPGPIRIDGDIDKSEWDGALRTRPFEDARGAEARPYSDARLMWGQGQLYLALYAADDDIHAHATAHDAPVWTEDAFSLRFDPGGVTYLIDISAAGVVSDARKGPELDPTWDSHVAVATEHDGTPNDSSDWDEEWLVEAALPLESLGVPAVPGTLVRVRFSRCDTPLGTTTPKCGAFGGDGKTAIVLE